MYIEICNVVRFVCVLTSGVLFVLLGRLLFLRITKNGLSGAWRFTEPNPASIVAVMLFIGAGVVRRLDSIGEPGDWFLWTYTIAIALLAAGVFHAMKIKMPWQRH